MCPQMKPGKLRKAQSNMKLQRGNHKLRNISLPQESSMRQPQLTGTLPRRQRESKKGGFNRQNRSDRANALKGTRTKRHTHGEANVRKMISVAVLEGEWLVWNKPVRRHEALRVSRDLVPIRIPISTTGRKSRQHTVGPQHAFVDEWWPTADLKDTQDLSN